MFKRQLPDILREHQRDLEAAFGKHVPQDWPARKALTIAEQPAAIALVLIDAIHTELHEASIGYAFRKEMRKGEKVVLATASRAGSKLELFSGLYLLVMVNWKTWPLLSPDQRVALIDHELCHFAKGVFTQSEYYAALADAAEAEVARLTNRMRERTGNPGISFA